MIGLAAPELRTACSFGRGQIGAETVGTLGQGEDCQPQGIGESTLPGGGCSIVGVDSYPTLWSAIGVLDSRSHRLGQGDGGVGATWNSAMVDVAAPEQCAVISDAEAVAALEQRQDCLSVVIGKSAFPGRGCPLVSVNPYPALPISISIVNSHGHRFGYSDGGSHAARDSTVVGCSAPELCAVQVCAETVRALL